MDAIQFNKQLDSELLATGCVTKDLYFRLADAYGYDAVTSVGWVEAKLRVLAKRLATGAPLSLYIPQDGSSIQCTSIGALQSWASALFPGVEVASA
jgi:hypothetical protein